MRPRASVSSPSTPMARLRRRISGSASPDPRCLACGCPSARICTRLRRSRRSAPARPICERCVSLRWTERRLSAHGESSDELEKPVMLLPLFVIGVVVLVVQWTRISALERQLKELRDRMRALDERVRPPVRQPPSIQPEPPPAPAPPVQPRQASEPTPTVSAVARTTSVPPAPAAPLLPDQIAVTAAPTPRGISLESRIGGRWLLYVGVMTLVIGAAYFEKLAIDNHWISETARTIEAGLFGAALVGAGLRFVRRGYPLYGQMLTGCGIAVLYVATYAAFNFYDLISRPVALTIMLAITALASWLADRERSQGLAVMAVGGGFATPFLLASHTDAQAALFSYDAILIAGTMYLAYRRASPVLNVFIYFFTVLIFA